MWARTPRSHASCHSPASNQSRRTGSSAPRGRSRDPGRTNCPGSRKRAGAGSDRGRAAAAPSPRHHGLSGRNEFTSGWSESPWGGRERTMRTATGLALIAIGAILAFAVTTSPSFLNLQVVGWILILTGVAGMVVPRRGYVWLRRRVVVRRPRGAAAVDPGGRPRRFKDTRWFRQN